MARKPTDTAHLSLRLPESLRKKIDSVARRNNVSLNTEMVSRLERSFSPLDRSFAQDSVNEMKLVMEVTSKATAALIQRNIEDYLAAQQSAPLQITKSSEDKS